MRILSAFFSLLLLSPAGRAAGLQFFFEPDHPSAIYHPTDAATITVVVENATADPLPLSGDIAFGPLTPAAAPAPPSFKALSLTPIAATTIAPGQRAKLPVAVTFGNVGQYQLRFRAAPADAGTPIGGGAGSTDLALNCIFAPRLRPHAPSPWVLPLTRIAAHTPGYLADLAHETSAGTFLLDDRFRFDLDAKVALAPGASLQASPEQLDALFAEAGRIHTQDGSAAGVVLRVSVPATEDPRVPEALAAYITDAARRLHGTLRGIVLLPELPAGAMATRAAISRFRVLYLAAYKAAKAADKSILMLGAGSVGGTRQWLTAGENALDGWLDGLALSAATEFPDAHALLPNRPLLLLPPGSAHWGDSPPAAALAEGAALVGLPDPSDDHGATAQLLGSAVLFQNLHPSTPVEHADGDPNTPDDVPAPLFIAVFQGDHFSVAAIAGLSAGTPLDARFPTLAAGKTTVTATRDAADGDPTFPNVRVADETQSMRAIDGAGAPIDCRIGDFLYMPAADKVVYLLSGGDAEDIAALLRPAPATNVPIFDFTLARPPAPPATALSLKLTNLTPTEAQGALHLYLPLPDGTAQRLATSDFPPIAPGKSLDLSLTPPPDTPLPAGQPLILEIVTPDTTQRTAVILH